LAFLIGRAGHDPDSSIEVERDTDDDRPAVVLLVNWHLDVAADLEYLSVFRELDFWLGRKDQDGSPAPVLVHGTTRGTAHWLWRGLHQAVAILTFLVVTVHPSHIYVQPRLAVRCPRWSLGGLGQPESFDCLVWNAFQFRVDTLWIDRSGCESRATELFMSDGRERRRSGDPTLHSGAGEMLFARMSAARRSVTSMTCA